MNTILDEPINEKEQVQKIPFSIYFLIFAVFIYFLSTLFILQSWPSSMLIYNIAIVCTLLAGLLSFNVFKKKQDSFLNFYLGLFLFAAFSKIAVRFVGFENPIRGILYIGEQFFIITILLVLLRYFVLQRPKETNLNVILYPLLLTLPVWIIVLVSQRLLWSYVFGMFTISVFVFFTGTVIGLILRLKNGNNTVPIIDVYLVIMTNVWVFGILFKVQSWANASELLIVSFIGGTLGLVVKFIQHQRLQKEQNKQK